MEQAEESQKGFSETWQLSDWHRGQYRISGNVKGVHLNSVITTYNSAVPYSRPLSCFNYDFSLPLTEVLVSLSRLWVHFPTHVQLGANTMPWIQPSLTSLQCDPHLPSLFILSVFSSFSSSMCYLDINDARGAAGFDLPRAHGEIPMASTSPHLCADGPKSIYSSTSKELRLKNKHLKFNPNHAEVLSSPWGKNNPLLSLGWSS